MRKLVLLMAGVALAAGAACKSLGKGSFAQPVVTVKNVAVTGVGLTGGSLDVNLNVYNPNGFALDAQRLTYQLFVDTVQFGTGATDARLHVGSKDSATIRVPVDFNWSGLGQVGRDLMNKGTVNYRVKGDLTVGSGLGNYTIPYDRTGRFSTISGSRP